MYKPVTKTELVYVPGGGGGWGGGGGACYCCCCSVINFSIGVPGYETITGTTGCY